MANIIFLGAPGSGKGTQAVLLSQNLNIPNISTGEILRKELALGSEIGNLAKSYMNSGNLVPDEVVVDIIKKRISLKDCENGFILDGFPRNLAQGIALEKMLDSEGKEIDLVLNIEVPSEIVIKRISGRLSCKKCGKVYNRFFSLPQKEGVCDECGSQDFESRDDDKEESVRNRLKVYEENSSGLVTFYRKKGLIYSVDGVKNTSFVNNDINKVVDLVVAKRISL
jgi:adenylate kinase